MRKLRSFIILMLMISSLAACGTKESSSNLSENKKGISGNLSFYTSQPDEDAQKLVDAFTKKYPDVQVELFRSGTEEVVSKILAENQAGNIQADVLLVADSVTFESLKEQDLLLAYKSEEANEIPESYIDKDHMYTGTKVMATALAVNTKNVTNMPDSWKVLADEKAKAQSIMPSPLYSGAAAYNVGVFTRQGDFGWDFYEQLKKNEMVVTKGNGAVLKDVAAGDKSYGMVVDFIVARAKAEGSPVELIYPKEGVPVITEPVGIIKDNKNEATSKAFVDFVLSEEGQQLASEIGYTPIRNNVKAPEGLKSIDEMKVLETDIKDLYKTREEDKKQFSEIFGE
ncbi:ABC transporter substrate-binding protein [Metabacillus fastidiosus]|uniref:ABC transporter substrate-binding protein n=1 Tax=Metabacillus fastidiosus TaxID=1458 RepID=UPI002E1BD575|nr:ABC transporter substrate-binding protein [Metabacillus fastidiosus]